MYTQTTSVIAEAVVLTAGEADVTLPASPYVSLEGSVAAVLDITLTNGATGPTLPADVGVQISDVDVGTYVTAGELLLGSVANAGVQQFKVFLPASVQNVRLLCGGNTDEDVTIDASLTILYA